MLPGTGEWWWLDEGVVVIRRWSGGRQRALSLLRRTEIGVSIGLKSSHLRVFFSKRCRFGISVNDSVTLAFLFPNSHPSSFLNVLIKTHTQSQPPPPPSAHHHPPPPMATSRPPSKPLNCLRQVPEERKLAVRRPQALRHLLGRP